LSRFLASLLPLNGSRIEYAFQPQDLQPNPTPEPPSK
jgi:hypothetical protein